MSSAPPLSLRIGLLCAIAFASAEPTPAGTIRHDRSDAAYTTLASDSPYAPVGRLVANIGQCSGTLVHLRWVVSAAHCLDTATSVQFLVGGTTYDAIDWFAHPDWDGNFASGTDLGLAQLADAVSGTDPALLFDELSGGLLELGTSVGFGKSGTGLTGATIPSGTKRAGTNVIETFGTAGSPDDLGSFSGEMIVVVFLDLSQFSSRILFSDFDNPDMPSDSMFGSPLPGELEYLVAPGDSGGGVFVDDRLAGVHSFVLATDGEADSTYGDVMGSTAVSPYADWIRTQVPEPSRWLLGCGAVGGLWMVACARRSG